MRRKSGRLEQAKELIRWGLTERAIFILQDADMHGLLDAEGKNLLKQIENGTYKVKRNYKWNIKEQNKQRLVLEIITFKGLWSVLFASFSVALIVFFALFIPWVYIPEIPAKIIGSLFSAFVLLAYISDLRATSITFDKSTMTATRDYASFFLIRKQQLIPVSSVEKVVVQFKWAASQDSDNYWEIQLDSTYKQYVITSSSDKQSMLELATEISQFLGVALEDKSEKPQSSLGRFFRKVEQLISGE